MKAGSLTLMPAVLLLAMLVAGCDAGQATPSQPSPPGTVGANSGAQPVPTGTTRGNTEASVTPTLGSQASVSSGAGIDLAAFDVCGLLSRDEIVSLMPDVIYKHTATDFDPKSGTKTCTYADGEGTGSLQLTLYTPDRWDDDARVIGESPEPVQGLGDEAVTETLKYAQVLAVLVRGRAAFLLTVNPTFTSDGKYDAKQAGEVAMQLARKIIPRLL